jgi:hypothetical protein
VSLDLSQHFNSTPPEIKILCPPDVKEHLIMVKRAFIRSDHMSWLPKESQILIMRRLDRLYGFVSVPTSPSNMTLVHGECPPLKRALHVKMMPLFEGAGPGSTFAGLPSTRQGRALFLESCEEDKVSGAEGSDSSSAGGGAGH